MFCPVQILSALSDAHMRGGHLYGHNEHVHAQLCAHRRRDVRERERCEHEMVRARVQCVMNVCPVWHSELPVLITCVNKIVGL